ncbi:cyclic diguanylate phosphodiesterase [Geomonas limicola]|uniref:Cyclic diguanylate phosphodiesterase n=1 Tax=Geomonas limicola TaxID=2740186 RepID=A0A6V8N2Q5_9BACT|nr:HD domain-containing phosphohydrolase [Geomonas limicola]GFO66802.1 cyclic diguanylate phosphodiesterase [Geomonas limicola]
MSEISPQIAQRVAILLASSVRTVMLYPLAHPAVGQPLQELTVILGELLEEHGQLHLGQVEGTFFLNNRLLVTPPPAVSDLAERLTKKKIEALTVLRGVTRDELFGFATLLGRREVGVEQLPEELEHKGIRSIRVGIEQEDQSAEVDAGLPARTYHQALQAVKETMREVECGRIPSGHYINTVVDNMVSVTMRDPTTLLGLSMIKDYDNYTFSHSVNVGILALSLGSFLGMAQESLRDLNTAGLLHDIGKTTVDKAILNNPGKLSAEEFEQMKRHAEAGAEIVGKMKEISPRVADAVLGHHIRFNRTGYPEWACNREFSEFTEMVAVADCYDAITTLRTYQVPTLPKEAMDIMRRLAGTTLNARLVEEFEKMMGEYPVGTLVRLDNNEIALVVKPHPMESQVPAIKVVMDPQGKLLEQPRLVSLAEQRGERYASIVSPVDPLLKNIDVAGYLLA